MFDKSYDVSIQKREYDHARIKQKLMSLATLRSAAVRVILMPGCRKIIRLPAI
jgi:hypothetical protein